MALALRPDVAGLKVAFYLSGLTDDRGVYGMPHTVLGMLSVGY